MRHLTSRIRAAIGAAMIVTCALPVTARAQAPVRREARAQARWFDGRGARQALRWRVARARVVGWRHGYARGYVAGRYPALAARWRWAYHSRAARARLYGRYWERRHMGGRWAI